MKTKQIYEEMRLNCKNQIKLCTENINLMIDFIYGGCLDEIIRELGG